MFTFGQLKFSQASMKLSSRQLSEIARCPHELSLAWLEPLASSMNEFEIYTEPRVAAFLAQLIHESAGLTLLVENLRYSAARLAAVWPRHFYLPPDEPLGRRDANDLAFKPELIANLVYANRMGNGSPQSGDGWRFRGRGLMQLTGRRSYEKAAEALRVDVVSEPDLLLEPLHAARSAAWYWASCGANAWADEQSEGAFKKISIAINGGLLGFEERMDIWAHAKSVLREST